jgi:hypothetical protein
MMQRLASAGIVAAAVVVSLNAAIGFFYVQACRSEGNKVAECWDRGLAISGLGSGGPLAAAIGIGGYALGDRNGFGRGYSTWNPALHKPEDGHEGPVDGAPR